MSKKIQVWKKSDQSREQQGGGSSNRNDREQQPMTKDERLYYANFEELKVLREQVYSKLNWWPRNLFLPERMRGKNKNRSPRRYGESSRSQNTNGDSSRNHVAVSNGASSNHPPTPTLNRRLPDSESSRNSGVRTNSSHCLDSTMSSETSDYRETGSNLFEIGRSVESSGGQSFENSSMGTNGNHLLESTMSLENSGSESQGSRLQENSRSLDNSNFEPNDNQLLHNNTHAGNSGYTAVNPYPVQDDNGLLENSGGRLNGTHLSGSTIPLESVSTRSLTVHQHTDDAPSLENTTSNSAPLQEDNRLSDDIVTVPSFDDSLVGRQLEQNHHPVQAEAPPASQNILPREEESESFGSLSFESSFNWSSQ